MRMRSDCPTPLPARAPVAALPPHGGLRATRGTRASVALLLVVGFGVALVASVVHAAAAAPAGAAPVVATTTSGTSMANPSVVAQRTALMATVRTAAGAAPSAVVTFREGTRVLGTGTWWFGTYNLDVSDLTVGPHTITATYAGDATAMPSTGAMTQTVD